MRFLLGGCDIRGSGYRCNVPEPETTPPFARNQATERVLLAGERAALAAGYRCVCERSPGSESAYLHVERNGVWYGVRVSCHAPAYDCSIDYEQLRLQEPPAEEAVSAAEALIAERALTGGSIVADPAVVDERIAQIASVMADGRVYRDADGTRWLWSADEEAWVLRGRHWGESEPSPPRHRPHPSVSARIRCQVRHSENVNARWASEQAASE